MHEEKRQQKKIFFDFLRIKSEKSMKRRTMEERKFDILEHLKAFLDVLRIFALICVCLLWINIFNPWIIICRILFSLRIRISISTAKFTIHCQFVNLTIHDFTPFLSWFIVFRHVWAYELWIHSKNTLNIHEITYLNVK